MWLTAPNRIGIAAWQCGDSVWRIEARGGGRDGIGLIIGDERLELVASGEAPLPTLDEQFVRSDEIHLSFPQAGDDCEFGFKLVVRPVSFDGFTTQSGRAAFELLVSVQTTRLDSHPTLDLVVPARDRSESMKIAGITGAAHLSSDPACSSAVLLGPQDAPFTSKVEEHDALRLRLFGEFLEKGVIRRARPWILVDRAKNGVGSEETESAWQALSESPLPLG